MVRPLTAECRGGVPCRRCFVSSWAEIADAAHQPLGLPVARRATSREINRQIALNLVREKQPISRAELARVMGMRRGAVSLLVNQLLEERADLRGGARARASAAGAPPTSTSTRRRSCTLAVDISASRTSMLLMDALGHPLGEVTEFPTRRRPRHW
jgi:hypothetical protein